MSKLENKKIETAELIIAYALSRLGEDYLAARGFSTWRGAYDELVLKFGRTPGSWKRLRDEFDPLFPNGRRGFHGRPLRSNRAFVFSQMQDVGDRPLLELVDRLIAQDWSTVDDAIEAVSAPRTKMASVAERLLTGRLAEEFFIANAHNLMPHRQLLDVRQNACGYDFDLDGQFVEVKGLQGRKGGLLFTDLEWNIARENQEIYWLVVVGDTRSRPFAEILHNPFRHIEVSSVLETRVVNTWKANFSLAFREQ